MLQVNKPQLVPVPDRGMPEAEFITPRQLYTAVESFLRRQYPVIAFVLLLALGLCAVYLLTTPPKYTGHAVLVIDAHKNQPFPQQAPVADVPLDSTMVDTQLEVLRSESIALSVVKELHLDEVPEFSHPRAGFVATVVGLVTNIFSAPLSSPHQPPSNAELTRAAVGTFLSRLSVRRVGMTYAIEIEFQSFDQDRAAQIANAVAESYVVDTLEAKYQTTRRAAGWLQDRLKELREQSSNAERSVVEFKAKNNIVDTGGRLMNEQQLAELNTALIQARAQTAEAQARLQRVDQILKSDAPDSATTVPATVADTLRSEVITKLRQQYLDLSAHESDWSRRFGPDHMAVVNVRNQMREIRRSILDELQRIAETYKSDYQIAKSREESVQKSLSELVMQSQTTNEAQVTLHSLESSAQTSKALYDTFLQRYMESVQQQSFPLSEARLITRASRGWRSAPNTMQVLLIAAMSGMVLGVGVGLLREIADRVFRTTGQVEEILQADCVAIVPLMKNERKLIATNGENDLNLLSNVVDSLFARHVEKIQPLDNASELSVLVDDGNSIAMASPRPKLVAQLAPRTIERDDSVLWAVIDAPLSRFTESIRAIKVAADLKRLVKENKVIGLTSSLPNEGKSTLAMAVAALIAQSSNVVLVDCDLRNPSLTRALARNAKLGILDLISGKASMDEVAWTVPESKLAFVPAVTQSRLAHSSEILASDAMRKFFENLRASYEYVIVDLSPLAPVVDVRAMTHLVDSFLFVVEWGRTKMDVVEHALDAARGVHENLLGVVLNKADMNTIGRYEAYRGNYYYKRYYARYGYTE